MREVEELTGETPPALQNRPLLDADCEKYLQAYFFLSASRQYNEAGQQALPVSEIGGYLRDFVGVRPTDWDTRHAYLTLIQSLDRVAMNHYAEQTKKRMAT